MLGCRALASMYLSHWGPQQTLPHWDFTLFKCKHLWEGKQETRGTSVTNGSGAQMQTLSPREGRNRQREVLPGGIDHRSDPLQQGQVCPTLSVSSATLRHQGLLSSCLCSHCSFFQKALPEPSGCVGARPASPSTLSVALSLNAIIMPPLLKRKARVAEVESCA